MKIRLQSISAGMTLLLCLITLCSQATLAQRPGGGPRGPGGRGPGGPDGQGPGGPGGPGVFDQRFARILDLTEAQKEQIKLLREQARTASQPYAEQIKPLREQLRPLIEASSFNESAVRALLSQMSSGEIEIQVIHARTESAVYNLLTADQKAKLAELRKVIAERIGNHMPGEDHSRRGMHGEHSGDALGLTDAQKQQIKALHEQAATASEPYREQLKPLHEQLRQLIEAGSFNESAVRNLAGQMATIQLQLQVIRTRTESAVYNLLTAEQKARLADLHKPRPGSQRDIAPREEAAPASGRRGNQGRSSGRP